jgi:hypothetical protein
MTDETREEAIRLAKEAGFVIEDDNDTATAFHTCTTAELVRLIALARASQAQPETKWVSVKERLPVVYETVLVAFQWAETVSIGCFLGPGMGWHWDETDNEEPDDTVTHWMPLPALPPTCNCPPYEPYAHCPVHSKEST